MRRTAGSIDSRTGNRYHTGRRAATRAVVLATLVCLIATGSASSHVRRHPDGDDVGGPFDISAAAMERKGRGLEVTVRTYERLRDRHFLTGDAFFVNFDSRGGNGHDFTLRMDYYEGSYPYCTLYDRDGFSRYGTEGQRGRRTFGCVFPRAELEPDKHIRWKVTSNAGGRTDSAPDRGWYEH